MTDDDLAGASIDTLKGDIPRNPDDESLAAELDRQRLRRLKQANDLRDRFYLVAVGLAGATVLTSIIMVLAVVFGVQIDPVVATAFISGLAVETVGVLAIMAGYLFPRDRGTEEHS